MKTMYICEKCGMTYDNFADANKCEDNHVSEFEVSPEWNESFVWNEGCAFPEEVVVRSKEWDWRTGKTEYKYFKYKSAGALTKKRVAELEAERIRKEEEAEAAHLKRVAEREAERKADHEAKAEPEQEVVG